MFSENVDYVLLYRDHRTVAKAPTHKRKLDKLLTYYDISAVHMTANRHRV